MSTTFGSVSWLGTSGSLTAGIVVVYLVGSILTIYAAYFLEKHAVQYVKTSTRWRVQRMLSSFYLWTTIFSVPLVLMQAALSSWLVAQYEYEGRFPTLGTRDGTRIILFCACWTWIMSLVFLWLVQCPPLWARKRRMPMVVVQAIWVALTWGIWVAGTTTMNRGLPLLRLKARCAGADYCGQLQFTCALSVFQIATFSLGLLKMAWAVRQTRKGVTEWY